MSYQYFIIIFTGLEQFLEPWLSKGEEESRFDLDCIQCGLVNCTTPWGFRIFLGWSYPFGIDPNFTPLSISS